MRALVQTAPERLEVREVDAPEPDAGEVLVRVEACGICGSDMHAYLGHDPRRPTPIVLGHEAAGTVEGSGRRVTINPLVGCGTCRACRADRPNICAQRQLLSLPPRAGAFAQFVAVREENLVEVPDGVSFAKASLAEPIACGWHAARLGRDYLGGSLDRMACTVLGGGPIGVGAALSLQALGAAEVEIVEPNAVRREWLVANGLDAREAPGDGRDVVVDAVGIPATRADASRIAAPGGVILHIGLGAGEGGLDARRMTLQEIAFIGTYTYTPQDFRDTAAAMFDGRLGPLDWIETRPLEAGQESFDEIRAGSNAVPKIVLEPQV